MFSHQCWPLFSGGPRQWPKLSTDETPPLAPKMAPTFHATSCGKRASADVTEALDLEMGRPCCLRGDPPPLSSGCRRQRERPSQWGGMGPTAEQLALKMGAGTTSQGTHTLQKQRKGKGTDCLPEPCGHLGFPPGRPLLGSDLGNKEKERGDLCCFKP